MGHEALMEKTQCQLTMDTAAGTPGTSAFGRLAGACTPDGARYNLTCIREAMRGILD